MRLIALLVLLVMFGWLTGAFAQQQAPPPDAADLARRLAVVEAQRSVILGWHTASEAARATLADELAKAQAKIKELETKPDPSKPDE